MLKNRYDLKEILELEKWQMVQDALAQSTKLAIITVDHKGVPITNHSGRQAICEIIRNDPVLNQYCQKCDARGGLEAVRQNGPYIYLCHCNIVDLAIPIIVDGHYLGAVMAGEIKLADESRALEHIISSPSNRFLKTPKITEYYDMLPVLSFEELEKSAQMLFELCRYIVTRVTEEDRSNTKDITIVNTISKETVYQPKDKKLTPVFQFIHNNYGEQISQKSAAKMCHLSLSYFSRLFSAEVGEAFPNYCTRVRINRAKKLLLETDLSVTQISDELGYSDPGYFIKRFKKFEGLTPVLFRKYYRQLD